MDDNGIFRRGLAQLIDQSEWGEVAGESGEIRDCINRLASIRPDVLLLDLYIGRGEKSFDYIPQLKEASPETKIVLLTMSQDDIDIATSTRYGLSGYLLSSSSFETIERGILAACSGKVVLDEGLGVKLYEHLMKRSSLQALSIREKEILELVRQGKSNKEIAQALYISEFTVKAHVSNILGKVGATRRSELLDL